MLLIFRGLPATGKSAISSAVARAMGGVYLRIDTIEQGLREAGFRDLGPHGYNLAYKLTAENLALGSTVVAESVNPIAITREAWREVGRAAGVQVIEIETICSDQTEHRNRVENRTVNIKGLKLPTWEDVQNREYEDQEHPGIVIDTSGDTPQESIEKTLRLIQIQIDS